MRTAKVYVSGIESGTLSEIESGKVYRFQYLPEYAGFPISLTMPVSRMAYQFDQFPPFFDGLLPEGHQLEGLLKWGKVDKNDYFSQLILVGSDTVGTVTIKEIDL